MQDIEIEQFTWNYLLRDELLRGGLERLPHAMLLSGPAGVGKASFAEELASLLLCESPRPENTACRRCQACHWKDTGNHPDFRRVVPGEDQESVDAPREKPKKRAAGIIRVDQIRELESFVFIGSHRNGNRIILVSDAEAMNGAAANSLLKILEEPPPSVYFILITSRIRALLPTLRSRCRTVPFGIPESAVAAEWLHRTGHGKHAMRYLHLAGGAPLQVAKWKDQGHMAGIDGLIDSLVSPPADPIALAARWDALLKSETSFGMEDLIGGIQRWLFDLAQESSIGEIRYHGGWARPTAIGERSDVALLAAWGELARFRRSARHPLNQLLFLENIAAHYLRAIRPTSQ